MRLLKGSKSYKSYKNKESNKSLIDRAWDLQNKIEVRQKRIGKGKYGRVLKMARKPTPDEFSKTSKITALGIILVGGMGFLVYLLCKHVAPWIMSLF